MKERLDVLLVKRNLAASREKAKAIIMSGIVYVDGQIVALIKPQFEAGREKVGKKGVVREKSTHIEVIHKVIDYAMSIGFEVLNLEFSPIKGPEGNIEYLVHLQKCEATDRISPEIDVEKTVDQSFATLAKG